LKERTLPLYSPERLSQAFLRALPFGLAFPTLPDLFSVPFPVGIHFQWPLEAFAYSIAFRLSFGESDFIRSCWPVLPAAQS
ncbi:hypothetical protein, partial [Streptomyces sp. SD15]